MTGIDLVSYLPALLFISEEATGEESARAYYLRTTVWLWCTEGQHWPHELAYQQPLTFKERKDEQMNKTEHDLIKELTLPVLFPRKFSW